ncbi:MAG: hypothetical protein OIF40_16220 [Mangrovicoccus sp.]|nr:hypothetical protein [Mangrovicoccus sp.]
MRFRASLLIAGIVSSFPMLGHAATFRIFTAPANTIGTFEAPIAGGLVSNLFITQSGVLFDIRLDANGPITYDPAVADFRGISSASFTNSANYPGVCGPGDCLMEIYPLPDGLGGDPNIPSDILAVDAMLNNIDEGVYYFVDPNPVGVPPSPVPLPPALAGLTAALAGLVLMRRRKRF